VLARKVHHEALAAGYTRDAAFANELLNGQPPARNVLMFLLSIRCALCGFDGTLMPKILKTNGQEIDQALRNVTRQYLVGDLQKPQALQHFPSPLIEIGITRYEKEGKLEPPHRHKQAFEFSVYDGRIDRLSGPDHRRGARIQEG
jgi:hypothetical protein